MDSWMGRLAVGVVGEESGRLGWGWDVVAVGGLLAGGGLRPGEDASLVAGEWAWAAGCGRGVGSLLAGGEEW